MIFPPGAGSERVVATLGPGKPQNVLASLLNGSKFNYVILGEPNNPGAVQKVILMAKVTSSSNSAPNTTAQNSFRPPPPPPSQPVEPPDDEYQQNEPDVENQNQLGSGQPDSSQQEIPGDQTLRPKLFSRAIAPRSRCCRNCSVYSSNNSRCNSN